MDSKPRVCGLRHWGRCGRKPEEVSFCHECSSEVTLPLSEGSQWQRLADVLKSFQQFLVLICGPCPAQQPSLRAGALAHRQAAEDMARWSRGAPRSPGAPDPSSSARLPLPPPRSGKPCSGRLPRALCSFSTTSPRRWSPFPWLQPLMTPTRPSPAPVSHTSNCVQGHLNPGVVSFFFSFKM